MLYQVKKHWKENRNSKPKKQYLVIKSLVIPPNSIISAEIIKITSIFRLWKFKMILKGERVNLVNQEIPFYHFEGPRKDKNSHIEGVLAMGEIIQIYDHPATQVNLLKFFKPINANHKEFQHLFLADQYLNL